MPTNCFIDQRKFAGFEELYSFLQAIEAKEFDLYLKNIEDYLNSSAHDYFRPDFAAKIVAETILAE